MFFREADRNADEDQRRRINDLEDSFQRLEKRMQEGDDEFQELANMVRDLVPRVERASSLVRNYTCHLSKDRNRCIPGDLDTKRQRSRGQQHNDGGSELSGQSNTKKQNGTPGHNGKSDSQSNTEKRKSKKKVRFADDSATPLSMNSVDSRRSGSLGENKKGKPKRQSNDEGYSHDRLHTAKVPLNDTGFKRRLTEKDVDNRLHYFRKIEIQKKENKHTVEESKEEKGAVGNDQDVTSSDNTSMLKDEAVLGYMKDELARHSETLMRSLGGHDDLDMSLFSFGLEETLKLVSEDPNIVQQIAQQEEHVSMETLMKDNMETSAYIEDMAKRADVEKIKGSAAKLPRGVGPDTVLCLDTSGSMEGAAFQEMISLAIKFVDGIQQVSLVLGIEENIGVSTFGKKPGVPLHLTNQYDKVKEVLLSLKAEGPSPMFDGIHMAIAACEGNGRRVTMRGIPVGSRIILMSDGKGTPDHWHLIGDTVDPNNGKAKLLVNNFMVCAGHLVKSHGNTVYSVPVGDYTEGTLERVARLSGGHIIQRHELGRLIQFAQHQSAAANYVCECRDLGEDVDREPFLRAMIGVESTSPGDSNFDHTKMDILTLALKFTKSPVLRKDLYGDKGDVMEEVNTYMPCIGTRVRRGPNWHWGNQDCEGPGTVVGHDSDKMVWVEWDLGRNRNVYHYLPGLHDVTVVDEERVLVAGEDIGVGCKVKRGKDWTFGDQDGGEGTVGIVCRADPAKTVHIRWPNKTVKRYNFGANGRFDVELINQREPSVTSASILPPRRREGSIPDKDKDARKEMSIEDMNRLNQRK
ncbi:uncharacterized protein LOC110447412 isoform X2 [Mizuhopecten yessoensis]|uniref:E3 ubiquitin-protein ligase mib1 n=1 Tax=Mizuhopecten yessoensis TaxID=6573 RepID=A0A210QVK6_MIZYE|nr:uncharacterized protein LOC110447412 isoform X2 [Mizuhopecten yessoensis]OWF52702.1 E3 ubiquitin-protein ligase mib1 [Mizuhopecten yessoensis]